MHLSTSKPEITSLLIIEFLFLSIGAGYLFYTPLWASADEERHFAYCEFIARHHTLAIFKPVFEENEVYMAFHPPLYYLLGSLVCDNDSLLLEEHILVNDGPGALTIKNPPNPPPGFNRKIQSAYILRCLSLLLSSITVLFVFKSAQLFFPYQLPIQIVATMFVAMNPQFTHVATSITNDSLNIMLATATLYVLACFMKKPYSISLAILCGMFAGCALMTKTTSLFLVPLVCCTGVYALSKDTHNRILPVLIMTLITAVIGGWWYARNWVLFDDPLFTKTIRTAHPWALRYAPFHMGEIGILLYKTLVSYFGHFGVLKVPLPDWVVMLYGTIVSLGCFGYIRHIITARQYRSELPFHVLFLCAVGGGLCFFAAFNVRYVGAYSGRYLFATISPTAILLTSGLRHLTPVRFRTTACMLFVVALVFLNLGALLFVVKPGYAEPRLQIGIKQELFTYPSPEINTTTSVGQSFLSPKNNLCGIQIVFSKPLVYSRGTVVFTLHDAATGTRVQPDITCFVKNIEDFGVCYVVFPPIADSAGKQYIFNIATHDLSAGNGLGLWHTKKDAYPDGTMVINNQPALGDLCFTVYYFTGDRPKTIWEGIKPTTLMNGIYLDIWEIQLYQEWSKPFRQTTSTHKKFLQLQQADRNRGGTIPK